MADWQPDSTPRGEDRERDHLSARRRSGRRPALASRRGFGATVPARGPGRPVGRHRVLPPRLRLPGAGASAGAGPPWHGHDADLNPLRGGSRRLLRPALASRRPAGGSSRSAVLAPMSTRLNAWPRERLGLGAVPLALVRRPPVGRRRLDCDGRGSTSTSSTRRRAYGPVHPGPRPAEPRRAREQRGQESILGGGRASAWRRA